MDLVLENLPDSRRYTDVINIREGILVMIISCNYRNIYINFVRIVCLVIVILWAIRQLGHSRIINMPNRICLSGKEDGVILLAMVIHQAYMYSYICIFIKKNCNYFCCVCLFVFVCNCTTAGCSVILLSYFFFKVFRSKFHSDCFPSISLLCSFFYILIPTFFLLNSHLWHVTVER